MYCIGYHKSHNASCQQMRNTFPQAYLILQISRIREFTFPPLFQTIWSNSQTFSPRTDRQEKETNFACIALNDRPHVSTAVSFKIRSENEKVTQLELQATALKQSIFLSRINSAHVSFRWQLLLHLTQEFRMNSASQINVRQKTICCVFKNIFFLIDFPVWTN